MALDSINSVLRHVIEELSKFYHVYGWDVRATCGRSYLRPSILYLCPWSKICYHIIAITFESTVTDPYKLGDSWSVAQDRSPAESWSKSRGWGGVVGLLGGLGGNTWLLRLTSTQVKKSRFELSWVKLSLGWVLTIRYLITKLGT